MCVQFSALKYFGLRDNFKNSGNTLHDACIFIWPTVILHVMYMTGVLHGVRMNTLFWK